MPQNAGTTRAPHPAPDSGTDRVPPPVVALRHLGDPVLDVGAARVGHDELMHGVPEIELAIVDGRHNGTAGLVSITRIGPVHLARVIHREHDRPDAWLRVWSPVGPLGLAGGGGTSYDGDLWFTTFTLGRVDEAAPNALDQLRVAIADVEVRIEVVPLAALRSVDLRQGLASRALLEVGCRGCGHPDGDSVCTSCRSAIGKVSGQDTVTTWDRERVVSLGVTLGEIEGGAVSLLDIEVYDRCSILRSWWAIEADEDQSLTELRSPLDRRLVLSSDAGDDLVVAPGSSWCTDGHGVLTDHRIAGRLDPGARSIRIRTPDGRALDATVDLPEISL